MHNEELRKLYASQNIIKGKSKVPVLTEHHTMEACWGSEGIAPLIL
jgi:hypothetical protein